MNRFNTLQEELKHFLLSSYRSCSGINFFGQLVESSRQSGTVETCPKKKPHFSAFYNRAKKKSCSKQRKRICMSRYTVIPVTFRIRMGMIRKIILVGIIETAMLFLSRWIYERTGWYWLFPVIDAGLIVLIGYTGKAELVFTRKRNVRMKITRTYTDKVMQLNFRAVRYPEIREVCRIKLNDVLSAVRTEKDDICIYALGYYDHAGEKILGTWLIEKQPGNPFVLALEKRFALQKQKQEE